MLNFLPKVVIWWNVGDALLGSSEYAIMGLVNLLLHCNASDLVLEILKKMTKSGGQFASASNRSNSGGLRDSSPRDLRPWTWPACQAWGHNGLDVGLAIKRSLVRHSVGAHLRNDSGQVDYYVTIYVCRITTQTSKEST